MIAVREKGFYWVQVESWGDDHNTPDGWLVCFWTGERWEFPGTDSYEKRDSFFDRIDERRVFPHGMPSAQ
ncbi:hypothetical protein [Tortoise microvirus 73]|nr:hypothetical protein [Tortoise microvirus 73]